ncbi:MAG: hypothetical protein ACRDRX_15115 [Pseudonocardiaceae bacterium]
MSDQLGLHASNQTPAERLAAGVEVVPWGSAAAQEAITRVCQEVTARCEQVIAAQASADHPNESTTSPAEEHQP